MKNLLLTLLALTSVCRVDARDYLPVYTEGKVWNYSYYEMIDGAVQKAVHQRYVAKDTIVGGKNCKVILSRRLEGPESIHSEEKEIVYENDKKVYSVEESSEGPMFVLRLDFNLALNDHFKIDNGPEEALDFYVVSEDSITGGNTKRKRIKLAYGEDFFDKGEEADCWIEGIGTTLTTWLEYTVILPTCSSRKIIPRFDSCYDGDVCIYKSEELPPSPSDFTAIESVSADKALGSGKIYNLAGQQVDNNYKGVVIQNGRKFRR